MNRILLLIFISFVYLTAQSQADSSFHTNRIKRFKFLLDSVKNDSARINYLGRLNFEYETENPDSSMKYGLAALELARKTKNLQGEARILNGISGVFRQQGRLPEALEYLFEGRKLAESIHYNHEIARSYRRTGMLYSDLKDFSKARDFDVQSLAIDKTIPNNQASIAVDYMILADVYETLNMLDSAQYYADLGLQNGKSIEGLIHALYVTLGNMNLRKNKIDSALFYYHLTIDHSLKYSDYHDAADAANQIALIYYKKPDHDSALKYALKGYELAQRVSYKKSIIASTDMLADLYDSTDARKSLSYYRISNAAKDSLFGTDNIQVIQGLINREETSRKAADDERIAYRNKIRLYTLLSGVLLLSIFIWLLYRNNRQKQKANKQLQTQKEELQSTLQQLQVTQAQLIQAEKMASLGQLTSGIAHEIQNPLNFVNNFSEVNDELTEEVRQEIDNGDLPAAKKILDDLKENGRIILQHGKRAESIVKSMLLHSRGSSAQRELTDLNALSEQYVRTALQTMRQKDEWSQFGIHTELDPNMGSYLCAPEEIGKVILNLLENAFLTVQEKKQKGIPGYQPIVRLITKRTSDRAIITVEDNGMGIPASIQNKIFQPFFTTRDPGQGTGLGLSLSYDIITKGYQAELKMQTSEGVGSVFTLALPTNHQMRS